MGSGRRSVGVRALALLAAACLLPASALAQAPAGAPADAPPARSVAPTDLEPLVARVALYPDDLLAIFKILTRQGQAAPAGRYNYVINGRMIAGFAMLAYPADYGKTGIKTFVVNHYGVVHERDLGASTAKVAAALGEYNPDASWNAVEP